jgi:hypothetical protein
MAGFGLIILFLRECFMKSLYLGFAYDAKVWGAVSSAGAYKCGIHAYFYLMLGTKEAIHECEINVFISVI